MYKRNHRDDNVARFKKSPSSVNWSEILDGGDANSRYDHFIKTFTEVYDECIPFKKNQKSIERQFLNHLGLRKVY